MSKGRRAVTVIFLIIFICALAFVLYKLFQIREITVTGNENFTDEYVISLSGLEYDSSVFTIDEDAVLQVLCGQAYIKPVAVNIRYPDCVDIVIEERKKAAYVEKQTALLLIDYEGYLLEVIDNTEACNLPLIEGLHVDEFSVGKRLEVPGGFKLSVLSSVLSQAGKSEIELVKIDIGFAADIILETSQGFTIEIGDDTNLPAKFELAKTSMIELVEMGKYSGILDVSAGTNAYYREN